MSIVFAKKFQKFFTVGIPFSFLPRPQASPRHAARNILPYEKFRPQEVFRHRRHKGRLRRGSDRRACDARRQQPGYVRGRRHGGRRARHARERRESLARAGGRRSVRGGECRRSRRRHHSVRGVCNACARRGERSDDLRLAQSSGIQRHQGFRRGRQKAARRGRSGRRTPHCRGEAVLCRQARRAAAVAGTYRTLRRRRVPEDGTAGRTARRARLRQRRRRAACSGDILPMWRGGNDGVRSRRRRKHQPRVRRAAPRRSRGGNRPPRSGSGAFVRRGRGPRHRV